METDNKDKIREEIMRTADCQKEIVALREAESTVLKFQEQLSTYQQKIKSNSDEIENVKIELRRIVARGGSVEKTISRRITCSNENEALASLVEDLEAVIIPASEKAVELARQKLTIKIMDGITPVKSVIEAGLNLKLTEIENTMKQWGDLHYAIAIEFKLSGLAGPKIYIQNREIRDALGGR